MTLPFKTPTTIGLFGPTQSGKTTFVLRLLENAATMFTEAPHTIVYAYGAWQESFKQLQKIPHIILHEGLPRRSQIEEWSFDRKHMLLILDDLMQKIVIDCDVQHYVTVSSHHNNISILMLMQSIFPQGKCARTISLNCHYMVLFNNKRDANQVSILGRQIMPGKQTYFLESYTKATGVPYGYLLVDLAPHSDRKYQLRTRIFPQEGPVIIYVPHM